MPNSLFLRLEGPMQSWGERARWSVRDSAPEPTKSGVVGLLGCALGWSADDDLRHLAEQIRVGVRCDRPGVAQVDYHTVGGGAETPMLLQADGKPKRNPTDKRPHTEQTWRTYLHDASFLIVVQADAALIAKLAEAVQAPHWPFFLGRKSCPPSLPVFAGVGDHPSLEDALRVYPYHYPLHSIVPTQVRTVLECAPHEGVRRRDQTLSRSYRTFAPRYAREVLLAVTAQPEET